jgi:hypothetical protein
MTYFVIGQKHIETQQVVNKLFLEEREQRHELQDNLTSSLQQMSVSFDTKIEEHMMSVREEIEFNMEVVDILNGVIKERFDESK